MASDRQQFERANEQWQFLHDEKAYSVPENIGRTAIVVSYDETFSSGETEIKAFTSEAYLLAATEEARGHRAEVILDAKGSDMGEVLRDPSIATIVTIGHGALSYIYMDNGIRSKGRINNRYDWCDVSNDADHLKTGVFVQRHCGNASRRLSVPLGSFAMARQNYVLAKANNYFLPSESPRSILDFEQLAPIPTSECLSYQEVKSAFSYDKFLEASTVSESAQSE